MNRTAVVVIVGALAAAGMLGCEDPIGNGDWRPGDETPDTVELFSLARPEYQGFPSAYDFTPNARRRVVVEQPGETGNWDVALSESDGTLVLLPPGSLQGVETAAGIQPVGADTSFDALTRAPTSGFNDSTAVAIEQGGVYVVRTRRINFGFFGRCFFYGKLEAIGADVVDGTLLFRYIANPNCNDPRLVPPEGD